MRRASKSEADRKAHFVGSPLHFPSNAISNGENSKNSKNSNDSLACVLPRCGGVRVTDVGAPGFGCPPSPSLFPVPKKRYYPQTTTPQEYLALFERYIDFLNLDVEVYLASMTHTSDDGGGGGDDDDDEDGGLGVATVNLAALKVVLTKHQVTVRAFC